jgi:hypothetical protein
MASYEISPETNKLVKEYATLKGIKPEEALERLTKTAVGRLTAINKYAQKVAGEKVPKAKKEAASKASGPIARKAASKAKAPKVRKPRAVKVEKAETAEASA